VSPETSLQLVATYYDGEAQHLPASRPPLTRAECRALKKEGRGLFQRHGTIFVLYGPPPLPPASSKVGNLRDESTCVEEPTMQRYVEGYPGARAIIRAWKPLRLRRTDVGPISAA